RETFHHLLDHTFHHPVDHVVKLIPEKCLEVVTLPRHYLREILARHGLKGLSCERFIGRTHRTCGTFETCGTFYHLGRIRHAQPLAPAERLQGLYTDQR